ncbi:MAG: hypothetical protein ACE5DK_07925, partial [Paracoccaceae bacterium]
ARFAFVALPLAFAYHLSHNLNHLAREGVGVGELLLNPFGRGLEAVGALENRARMMHLLLSQEAIWSIQAILMAAGFVGAMLVIQSRAIETAPRGAVSRLPMILFATGMTGVHLWILMQPMMMRF